MREKDLLRTIGNIDDEYVKEAEPKMKYKVKSWVKWLSAAAGICLIIVVGVVMTQQTRTNKDNKYNKEKGSIDIGKNEAGFPEIGYEVNEDKEGYSYIDVNVQEDPEEQWAEDGEYMVDISFAVKDEYGNPMKNITYSLEYISGERGSYQPGYGITDSTGEFTRRVHPNAVYILRLQKRNQVSYAKDYEAIVYEEMTVTLDVTKAFTKEIIWKDEEVTKLAEKSNPVTIDISDVYDGDCEDVFLQLFTKSGEQIQLGYPEKNGEFTWYDSEYGSYYLTLQIFEENDGNTDIKYAKSYVVTVVDGKMDIIGEQKEEIPIPE